MRTFLLAVCGLVVAAGAVEVVLRATHLFNARVAWTEPDPHIGWRFTPGREYWFFGENDHPIRGRINSLGWRDRERARAKATETVRVAVLGDSYVEAFQVESDSTFVVLAERRSRARGAGYEFLNFGRSGMGPGEEYIVLQRDVFPCRPDAVVLVFTPHNDLAEVAPSTTRRLRPFFRVDERDSLVLDASFSTSPGYRLRACLNPLKQRSALVSLVFERYNARRAAQGRGATPSGAESATLKPEYTMLTAHADSQYVANYGLAKRLIVEMSRECAAKGVSFVVMSVPLVYEDEVVSELRVIDPTLDPTFFDRDLAALADATGFAFLPLTDPFADAFRATGQRLHWAHWNYAGHRLVGKVLADALAALSTPPAAHRRTGGR